MTIAFTERNLGRVRSLVESGQFRDDEAVLDAALELLERRERLRTQVQEGVMAADRGELIDHQTVFAVVRERIAAVEAARGQ